MIYTASRDCSYIKKNAFFIFPAYIKRSSLIIEHLLLQISLSFFVFL